MPFSYYITYKIQLNWYQIFLDYYDALCYINGMGNILALMCVVFGGGGDIDQTCIDRLNSCAEIVAGMKPGLKKESVLLVMHNEGSEYRARVCRGVLGYDYRDGLKVR